MRRVLVVHYSQTGQLNRVVESATRPLVDSAEIEVVFEEIRPAEPYPFPWPFLKFFSIFPESIHMVPPPIRPTEVGAADRFDLIILAYQVWFLAPSLPITAFLRSPVATGIFENTPVVTVIACRGMWLMAQEKVKAELGRLRARLLDNVVLVDAAGSAASFLATPLWMFTGKKQPWRWVPPAGVAEEEIAGAERFGHAMAERLAASEAPIDAPMLKGLGAVKVNERLIASERIANRSFSVWGNLMRRAGGPDSARRRAVLFVYLFFLIAVIILVVPITAAIKALLAPFTRRRIAEQKRYYASPSGE